MCLHHLGPCGPASLDTSVWYKRRPDANEETFRPSSFYAYFVCDTTSVPQVFDYFFLMFCFSVGVSFHSIQPLCKKSRGHPPDISDDKITPYLPRRLADRCNPKIIPWHEPEPGYVEYLYISIPPATCTIDGNVPGAYVG